MLLTTGHWKKQDRILQFAKENGYNNMMSDDDGVWEKGLKQRYFHFLTLRKNNVFRTEMLSGFYVGFFNAVKSAAKLVTLK